MQRASFPVDEYNTCVECWIALRRFLGRLDGVFDIEDRPGEIVIVFDETKISREMVTRIAQDSIRKLGY